MVKYIEISLPFQKTLETLSFLYFFLKVGMGFCESISCFLGLVWMMSES